MKKPTSIKSNDPQHVDAPAPGGDPTGERCHICLDEILHGEDWQEVKEVFRNVIGAYDFVLVAVHDGCQHGRRQLTEMLFPGPTEPGHIPVRCPCGQIATADGYCLACFPADGSSNR